MKRFFFQRYCSRSNVRGCYYFSKRQEKNETKVKMVVFSEGIGRGDICSERHLKGISFSFFPFHVVNCMGEKKLKSNNGLGKISKWLIVEPVVGEKKIPSHILSVFPLPRKRGIFPIFPFFPFFRSSSRVLFCLSWEESRGSGKISVDVRSELAREKRKGKKKSPNPKTVRVSLCHCRSSSANSSNVFFFSQLACLLTNASTERPLTIRIFGLLLGMEEGATA